MKKILIFLICLSVSVAAFAQKKPKPKKMAVKTAQPAKKTAPAKKDKAKDLVLAKPKPFKVHKSYLMAEKANVRKEANTKSDVVMRLATGSEVTVLSPTKESATIDNVTAVWYKVVIRQDTVETDGYLWGGYLSDLQTDSKKDASISFLFRRNNEKEWAVMATRNGELLSTLKVATAIDHTYKVRNNVGYDKINDAIILSGKHGEFAELEELLIWDGKKLLYAGSAKGGAKPGTDPMHHETFIVDGDKGAKKGCILKVSTDEIEWDGSIYQNSATSKTIFKWNGEALIE